MHSRAALIQSISWSHRAYPLSKSSFIFTLPSENNLTLLQKPTLEWVTWNYFLGGFLKTELQYGPCPMTTCQETPGTLTENCEGMNAKQAELFSFSPPPAQAWTCWQQGGMKMVLSPTSLLDKKDCALHQKSLFITSVNIFLACHSWQSLNSSLWNTPFKLISCQLFF